MTDDADLRSFLAAFSKIADLATRLDTTSGQKRFADAVTERLGTDAAALTVLTEDIPPHRYLDWDIALGRLMAQDPDAVLLGIGGGQARYHQVLGDILADRWTNFPVGQVDYVNLPSGPDTTHQAIGLGARSFTYRGSPVLVFQRRGGLDGDVAPAVDVMSTDAGVAVTLLDELRRLSDQTSVLRGQVLTLGLGGNHRPVYQFLPRTRVPASDVILPPGTLERIGGHVQGIARHADRLRAHGQHLKRGVLLYGPPGTGKTHTVRHLLGELDGHTVVLLRGQALTMISQAAAMARTMQPSVVVLEDCDLVAEDRSFDGSTGVLFEVLDAVDGIDGDVDVTFVLTTNRIDVLEEALAQLMACRPDAETCLSTRDGELRVYRGELYCLPQQPPPPDVLPWAGESVLSWAGGQVRFMAQARGGIAPEVLTSAPVRLCPRQGGERLQAVLGRPRRSVRNLLQEAGMPPWVRARLPYLWIGERLAWVGGIGVDASLRSEFGLLPVWDDGE